jgi:hypothetical protein
MAVAPVITEGITFTENNTDVAQPVGNTYDITELPAINAFVTPVADDMLATAVLLLIHTPPMVVVASVVLVPGQICVVPVMGAGVGNIFIVALLLQPLGALQVKVTMPAATPTMLPVALLMVAIDGSDADHVHPAVIVDNDAVLPRHRSAAPVITGRALTVTTASLRQPVATL